MGGTAMGVIVEKPGMLTTVQDLGRYGNQRNGIIVSGAMDSLSIKMANLIVGNNENEAALEVTLLGPSLRFLINSVIAICGGDLSPTLNKDPIPLNKPIFVQEGDLLEFGTLKNGCRSYIAFKGGIQVEGVLGSKSTCIPAGFGGFNGRSLIKDDILPIHNYPELKPFKIKWQLSPHFSANWTSNNTLRFIKGRQYHMFDEESLDHFKSKSYQITKDSNRMGYRIQGHNLSLTQQQEILTEGVTFGSVQIPSNGQPIILMADRQTTGGYPKIAQIISIDLPILAQLKPGDTIVFEEISLKEAQQMAIQLENKLRSLKKIILQKWKVSGF
jgi:antagonist of KipI